MTREDIYDIERKPPKDGNRPSRDREGAVVAREVTVAGYRSLTVAAQIGLRFSFG